MQIIPRSVALKWKDSNTSKSGTMSVPCKALLLDENSSYGDEFLCKLSICSSESVSLDEYSPKRVFPLPGSYCIAGRIMVSQAGVFGAVGTAFAAADCAAESFRGE